MFKKKKKKERLESLTSINYVAKTNYVEMKCSFNLFVKLGNYDIGCGLQLSKVTIAKYRIV